MANSELSTFWRTREGNESFIGHLEYTLNKTDLVTVETTAASDGGERSEADGKAKAKQKRQKNWRTWWQAICLQIKQDNQRHRVP